MSDPRPARAFPDGILGLCAGSGKVLPGHDGTSEFHTSLEVPMAGMGSFHVDSEVGRLRRVIVHRPDFELKRLTPSNKDELLFDEVLWVERAKQEHDKFTEALREQDVDVIHFDDLL